MTVIGRLLNESSRAPGEVEAILAWTLGQVGRIEHGKIVVKVVDTDTHGSHGFAFGNHRRPKWVGRYRYGVRLAIATGTTHFDFPRVCFHSAAAKKLAHGNSPEHYWGHIFDLYDAGERRFGRWPIYTIHDWREDLVHLAAHEFQHILSFDRADQVLVSEIRCELTAERVLDQWRRDLPLKGGTTTTTAHPPSVTLAKMGDGTAWHILAGIVTDDIAKTACGIRRVPVDVEAGIDGRAVRHRGANVCANCRIQTDNKQGDTTMPSSTLNAALQKEAGKAARSTETEGKSEGGVATKTRGEKARGEMSAIKAAEMILRLEGKPLKVKEITERILAMTETRLGGKTPSATVGAILAVDSKKPGSVFRRTKPGTYTIRKGK